MMTWIGVALALLCLYLLFKVVGFLMKLLLWTVVLCGLYWAAATFIGLPLPY